MESIQQTLPTIYLRDIASFKKRDSHHNVPMQGLRLGAVKGLGKGHWADSGRPPLREEIFWSWLSPPSGSCQKAARSPYEVGLSS